MNNGALLDLKKCTIRFGGLTAVNKLDLQIGPRDLIGLIGPNGAGKTTVFNVVTGVYRPSGGTISFEHMPIAGLKPSAIARRGIARTFQNIRLFATLSVFDNVRAGFNLRLRHGLAHALWRMRAFYREENEVARQVDELLDIFDLGKFRDSLCSSLSYGDQRRLEIVRALATRPKLLLLDEPLAALDRKLREETQFELKEVQRRLGVDLGRWSVERAVRERPLVALGVEEVVVEVRLPSAPAQLHRLWRWDRIATRRL